MKGDFTIRATLFTSKVLASGEHPIMLVITKDRKRSYKSTGLSCAPNLWNTKKEAPKSNHPNGHFIQQVIDKLVNELRSKLLEFRAYDKPVSAEKLYDGTKVAPINTEFCSYTESVIELLETSGKIGNANCYSDMLRVIKVFLGKRKAILFGEIDIAFLNKLEAHLRSKGLADTSISTYFRTLRAVFNRARLDEAIPQDMYPFAKFKISKFKTETQKRAITKVEVKRIIAHDASSTSKTQLAKDLFLFSYFGQGINMIDMANLCWRDIIDDRFQYRRSKTKATFSIKLLAPALEILDRYRPLTMRSVEDYVFPILDNLAHKTEAQKANRIQKLTAQTNKHLKEIGSTLGIGIPLTTYVARHTYATVLKHSGQSVSVISEAMGHKSEAITRTYLKSFENAVIDAANESLL